MDFEWDEAKRLLNRRKHGLDFIHVLSAFEDPHRHEDVHHIGGEERCRLIGATSSGLVLVIYVDRRPKMRLISARRATRHEKALYHASSTD